MSALAAEADSKRIPARSTCHGRWRVAGADTTAGGVKPAYRDSGGAGPASGRIDDGSS